MSKAIYSISALSFKSLVLNRKKLSKKEAGGRLKYIQFSRLTSNGKWCKLIM